MTKNTRISEHEFVAQLLKEVPTARDTVDEQLETDGEMLLHILMSDLLRLVVARFAAGDEATSEAVLSVVDQALRKGDDALANAVRFSFVENYGAEPGESLALLDTWPPALRNELTRQGGRLEGASLHPGPRFK